VKDWNRVLLPEGEIKVKLLENHWVEITGDRMASAVRGFQMC